MTRNELLDKLAMELAAERSRTEPAERWRRVLIEIRGEPE